MLLFNPVGTAPAHSMGFSWKLAVWHIVVVLRNKYCSLSPGRPVQVGRCAGQAIGPQSQRSVRTRVGGIRGQIQRPRFDAALECDARERGQPH